MAFLKKKEKEICMSDLPSPPNPPPPWLGLTGGSLLPPHLAAADLALKRLSVAAVSYECCGGPASNWPWWPRAFAQLRRRQLSGSISGRYGIYFVNPILKENLKIYFHILEN